MKGVTETIRNETKEQKGGFLGMLIGILVASLLRNMLASKNVICWHMNEQLELVKIF